MDGAPQPPRPVRRDGRRRGGRVQVGHFFTELNAAPKKPYAYPGNEPTLNTPWAYACAGAPHRTQDVARRALTSIFTPVPEGLVGNDDLGRLSSWAVWAALGLYPQAPGRADLVVASPQFPSTTVRRATARPSPSPRRRRPTRTGTCSRCA
ncbi:glycoside hydrolase family 92 protein [Saccharothrix sp. MB29]|nr:glycoside hydrolase family 92 protein [Saccharothrix sp. MB29]